jgi:hypothetical protein
MSPQGYFFAMMSPPPSADSGEREEGAPAIRAVNGAMPFDALEARLKEDLAALPSVDGIILAAEPGVGATDVLRTWDVIERRGVRKVRLALF